MRLAVVCCSLFLLVTGSASAARYVTEHAAEHAVNKRFHANAGCAGFGPHTKDHYHRFRCEVQSRDLGLFSIHVKTTPRGFRFYGYASDGLTVQSGD